MDKYYVDVRFEVEAGSGDAALDQIRRWLIELKRTYDGTTRVYLPAGVSRRFQIAQSAMLIEGGQ